MIFEITFYYNVCFSLRRIDSVRFSQRNVKIFVSHKLFFKEFPLIFGTPCLKYLSLGKHIHYFYSFDNQMRVTITEYDIFSNSVFYCFYEQYNWDTFSVWIFYWIFVNNLSPILISLLSFPRVRVILVCLTKDGSVAAPALGEPHCCWSYYIPYAFFWWWCALCKHFGIGCNAKLHLVNSFLFGNMCVARNLL